jgi:uncharacterized phage-associated protein
MSDIKSFAQAILNFYNLKGDYISNKKLQKLLYYIQAWHFVYFEGENIYSNDELPQAWVHGPVYQTIYNEYKEFTFNPIVLDEIKEESIDISLKNLEFNEDQIDLIKQILNKYGIKSAFELEYLSHSEAPWLNARKNIKPHIPSTNTITKEEMVKYYSTLLS